MMASKQSTCRVCEMSKSIVPKDFYVYVHRRATDGQVFYVGKGRGQRAWSNARNEYWHRIVKKHGLLVEIIVSGLQEWYAFELELELITKHGRETLCNLTNGGDGASGCIRSVETRKKISKSKKGVPLSDKHKSKISSAGKGKSRIPFSDAHKAKMSVSKKGVPHGPMSNLHKSSISAAKKGKSQGPLSNEHKAKMRSAKIGVFLSEEHKEAIRASLALRLKNSP